MNVTISTDFSPWVLRKPPTPPPPVIEDDDVIIMKKFYISLGEVKILMFLRAWHFNKTYHF